MKHFFFILPLFSLLIACSTTPPIARNLPHTKQEAAYNPPNFWFITSHNRKIPIRLYRPANNTPPHAVILAFHGFGDSRDGWETLASKLTKENILIAAPDCPGFGEAPPAYSWTSTKELLQISQEEISWLHQYYPHIPLYLLGESMGGAQALLLNQARNHLSYLKGTILLSPAMMRLTPPLPTLLSLWNFFTPDMILTAKNAPGPRRIATTNIPALRRFYFDPLTQHYTKIHALHGLVSLMAEAYDEESTTQTPLLVIYGDHDDFIPQKAILEAFQRLPPQTRFDVIPNGHHLLSREKYNIAEDILSWIKDPHNFLPSGGDFRALTFPL